MTDFPNRVGVQVSLSAPTSIRLIERQAPALPGTVVSQQITVTDRHGLDVTLFLSSPDAARALAEAAVQALNNLTAAEAARAEVVEAVRAAEAAQ